MSSRPAISRQLSADSAKREVPAASSVPGNPPARGRLLFINRVFPPVGGATGIMLDQLTRVLVQDGWEITIVASRTGTGPAREVLADGRCVEWVHGGAQAGRRLRQRAWAYVCLYPLIFWRLLRVPRPDVVIPMTDPPLQVVLGPLLRLFRGVRVVHWAQDIYPEVAEALKVVKTRGLLANTIRFVSNRALRRCHHVVVIGRCMRDCLLGRGLPADQISVIPNWADTESIHPRSRANNGFRQRHGVDGKFVVMYSGNFGLAHNTKIMLEAALELRDRSDVHFLFVGAGSRLAAMQETVIREGVKNVQFLPPQPEEMLSESFSAGDIHLVTLQPGVEGTVVPSKLYGIFAAGRPALYVGSSESEGGRLLLEHQCGSVLPHATGSLLAKTILEWQADPRRCREAGERARRLADAGSLRRCAGRFSELFASVMR